MYQTKSKCKEQNTIVKDRILQRAAGETEYKLAQAIAGFLGKHMES